MTSIPENLKYTKDHEWIQIDGETAVVGITDFAQHSLGDIVFVELPDVGSSFQKGDTFGVVESIKSVSDLYLPVSGEVLERNEDLEEQPDLCNQSPYKDAWMVKIKIADSTQLEELLSSSDYSKLCESN